jgi:hypothetical protein
VRTEFGQRAGRAPGIEDEISERFALDASVIGELIARLMRHPRRLVVIPWYYRWLNLAAQICPPLTDFIVDRFYARPLRRRPGK